MIFRKFRLVAILDADKEGFLRSERSLIQTAGRAARNVDGKGHPLCGCCNRIYSENHGGNQSSENPTKRIQQREQHHAGDDPQEYQLTFFRPWQSRTMLRSRLKRSESEVASIPVERISREIDKLTAQMFEAARDLEFEKAAELRDLIRALEQKQIKYGSP